MYGQSGAEGGPVAYPRQDLTLACGIPVVRGCAVLQWACDQMMASMLERWMRREGSVSRMLAMLRGFWIVNCDI